MKRKSAWLSFTACALTAAATLAPVQAEPVARPAPQGGFAVPNYDGIQVIAFPNGQVGFFQKNSGTLYIYDSSLENCVGVRQLGWLGEPLKHLKVESSAPKPK